MKSKVPQNTFYLHIVEWGFVIPLVAKWIWGVQNPTPSLFINLPCTVHWEFGWRVWVVRIELCKSFSDWAPFSSKITPLSPLLRLMLLFLWIFLVAMFFMKRRDEKKGMGNLGGCCCSSKSNNIVQVTSAREPRRFSHETKKSSKSWSLRSLVQDEIKIAFELRPQHLGSQDRFRCICKTCIEW